MHTTVIAILATVLVASPPTTAPELNQESHCVVVVEGQKSTGELVMGDPVCFGSFSEAFEETTGQAVPAGTVGADVFTDTQIAALAASFTIGIHYSGTNGSGSSISVVGDSCVGGWWNTPPAWSNQISSSYNGCPVLRYYDRPGKIDLLGKTSGAGTTKNLPAPANDMAESVTYSSS